MEFDSEYLDYCRRINVYSEILEKLDIFSSSVDLTDRHNLKYIGIPRVF